MVSGKSFVALGAMCVLALLVAPAGGEMLVPGPHVAYVKSVTIGSGGLGIGTVAGLSFDPTYKDGNGNYDRVYLANREDGSDNDDADPEIEDAGGGLFSVLLSTEAVSSRLALAAYDEPYDTVVDPAGQVYVCYSGTSAIYRVTNPQSGSPTQTKILGNYGWYTSGSPSDDDPVSIDMMPAGFGLAGYGEGDLLLLDNGIDWNDLEGLSAISKDSRSSSQIYQNIWNDGDASGEGSNDVRGKLSAVDKKFYFARMAAETVDVGGTTYPAIFRVGGDGVLETIALNLPAGETYGNLDDSCTVNPVDGSVWFVKYDADNRRVIFRVDMASATAQGGGVWLADVTSEITWSADEGFNIGVNDMAWSPDGKTFVIGNPSSTDTLTIFAAVPEPGACVLIALGLMAVTMVRRRQG